MCREKHKHNSGSEAVEGSPLRVQGKVQHYGKVRNMIGITPACAGKSHTVLGY